MPKSKPAAERGHPRQIRLTDAEHAAVKADALAAGFKGRDGEGDLSAYTRHLYAQARVTDGKKKKIT